MSDSLNVQVGDFVLVQQVGKKHVVKVEKIKGDDLGGRLQEKAPYEGDTIPFERKEVVANYGQRPHKSVFEAYFKSFDHPDIGRVNFFYKASKEEKAEVEKKLSKAFKVLSKNGLTGYFPLYVEIRPAKGKMLGHYKPAKGSRKQDDTDGMLDIICLRPSEDHPLEETFYHECAHAIWRRSIHKRKAKAAWIRDYKQFIQVQHLTSKSLRSLMQELLNSNQPLGEFKKGLEEDSQLILREVVSYIKKFHRLTPVDINLLLESGDHDTVQEVWPTDNLSVSKIKQNNISNYSLKNVEEYFAECVATYLQGKKVPSHTEKLLTKTFQSI